MCGTLLPGISTFSLLGLFINIDQPLWFKILEAFIWIGASTLSTIYLLRGMSWDLPILRDDGFIIPQRDKIGKTSEYRENFLIPYSDVLDVMHFQLDTKKGLTEWIFLKFKFHGENKSVTLFKTRHIHNMDKFVETLRLKGIEFKTTHFDHS